VGSVLVGYQKAAVRHHGRGSPAIFNEGFLALVQHDSLPLFLERADHGGRELRAKPNGWSATSNITSSRATAASKAMPT